MRKKIISCLFLTLTSTTASWASVLTPSEIEALRAEFEGLNSYKNEPSYKVPTTPESNSLSSPSKKSQFVDLDSVFDEENVPQAAPVKRKRQ